MPMPAGDPPLSLQDLDVIGVGRLRPVRKAKPAALAEMEIYSILDLLQHYPRRYIDRTKQASHRGTRRGRARLRGGLGAAEFVEAHQAAPDARRGRDRRRHRPAQAHVLQPALAAQEPAAGPPGRGLRSPDAVSGLIQMTNPVVDLVGDRTGRFFPVYPQSEKAGLDTWDIAGFVEQALNRCVPRRLADPVPAEVRSRFDFVDRHTAMNWIHRPATMQRVGAGPPPARVRRAAARAARAGAPEAPVWSSTRPV